MKKGCGELYPGEFEAMEHNGRMDALEQEPCDVFDEYGNYKYPGDVELTEPNTATSMPCEDAVSRQAVCNIIDDIRDCVSVNGYWAFLERLKKLPPVHSQPNKEDIHREREQAYMRGFEDGSRKYRTEQSEDAISRTDMLDAIGHGTTYTSEGLQKIIKGLPPVNPQPKTGHWIRQDNTKEPLYSWYFCSECNSVIGDKTKFCSNCGAKMIEPQESEG